MTHEINNRRMLTDKEAFAMVDKFKTPLREAVASVVWWDNVDRCNGGMPMTLAECGMSIHPAHRKYPPRAELVAALIQCGYTPRRAESRVVVPQDYNQLKRDYMLRLRIKRKAARNAAL